MRKRLTHILAFLLPALAAFYLGWVAHGRALVDLDTVAAMGNAWRVFHWQDAANMALIGFDQPPLMALLFVPLAAFVPRALVSGLAAPVLGALFLGLSTLVLWRLSRSLGLPWWVAGVVCAGFTAHPLVLSYAMLGARGIVLTFVLLGLAASLVSWHREQRVRDIVTGSFFAAAAILLAYETVAVLLMAALYLGAHCRTAPERRAAKAEGLLVAFLMPAAYVALVWIGANWAIMGDPWHFWPKHQEAATGDISATLSGALAVALAACPLLLALLYHGLRGRRAGFAAPAAWLVLAALAAVLVFPQRPGSVADPYRWTGLGALAACALGVGAALLVALLAQLWAARREGSLRQVLSPGLLIIACGSLYLAWGQQVQQHVLPVGFRTVLRGQPAFAKPVGGEWATGDRLRGALAPDRHHVIAGPTAYVVALRAEAKQNVFVSPTSQAQPGVPHGDLGEGSLVVVYDAAQDVWASWQAQKLDLMLDHRWRHEADGSKWHRHAWGCYQFVPLETWRRGHPGHRGATILREAPHAHSRR